MTERQTYLIFVILALAVFAVHNAAIQPWTLDDAFISFRYAQNLIAGHGLVYNPGEKVEGYTCFLWVMLLTLGRALSIDLVFWSKLLGVLFGAGCILLLSRAHRFGLARDAATAGIAALILGTCGAFTTWATSGMEVTLFAFLILLAVTLQSGGMRRNRPVLLGLVCALAALTRPEGLLITAIILWHAARRGPKTAGSETQGPKTAGSRTSGSETPGPKTASSKIAESHKRTRPSALLIGLGFAVIYVPYFIWRIAYYGDLLPNTFYAKVGGNLDQVVRGVQYLTAFIGPAFLILASIIAALIVRAREEDGGIARERSATWAAENTLPLVIVAVYTLYVVLVGGDAMPAFRFFAPIMPLLSLLAARGLRSLFTQRAVPALLVAIIAIWGIVQMRTDVQIHDHLRLDKVAAHGRETGLWLRANAPRDAVVATNTAGSIPYYSGLRAIDMLGMTDRHIAHRSMPKLGTGWAGHEKGDGAYVLSRRPDFIIFDGGRGSELPYMPSDREMYALPEFRQLYSLRVERLASGTELRIYQRRAAPTP